MMINPSSTPIHIYLYFSSSQSILGDSVDCLKVLESFGNMLVRVKICYLKYFGHMRENTGRPITFFIKMILHFIDCKDLGIFQCLWKITISEGFINDVSKKI